MKSVGVWMVGFWLLAHGARAQISAGEASLVSAQHGFPAMRNLQGDKLADGEFLQWLENGTLHVTIDYNFSDGRHIQEKSSLQLTPALTQETWGWNESKNGVALRHFEVDFRSGKAIAETRMESGIKRQAEDIKVEPGRTFAGFAFALAIERERGRLVNGEKIKLKAIGFTPKPRVVSVEISSGGLDRMRMGNRIVQGDRFIIHPEVPAIAKLFVEAKDTHIWLTTPPAAGFLRWEGPLVENDDPMVRVDLLSSEQSGTAEPAPGNEEGRKRQKE